MSTAAAPPPVSADPKSQLRKTMGFWDVLLFNIATVLGPRWIAAAGHNGTSSISLWVIAAAFFFVPSAFVINELSSRFPEEGGLYVWTKEAFGDFHGFVAGWTYWIYTVFYFPGLLLASASMSAYIIGEKGTSLAQDRPFLLAVSIALLLVAVGLNIIGLNIGKWLQNAGGVGTYTPLLMLVGIALLVYFRHGSATHFTGTNMLPTWNWDTVNFWSQIAFAFSGLELVSCMCEEVRNPRKTLPRAVFVSGAMIAFMYIVGTFSILALAPPADLDPKSGVFHAITVGSVLLKMGFLGILAAVLVTVGNAGGVGSTVAGVARVPFVVGIDRYLPEAFGKIHSRWKTPYISILVQAGVSCAILLLSQIRSRTVQEAYQILIDATIILYFIPFLYMFAGILKLSGRRDRAENPHAMLIPGGKPGLWACGLVGFVVVVIGIFVSLVPPGETVNKWSFELRLLGGTLASIFFGLMLYWRGARSKAVSLGLSNTAAPTYQLEWKEFRRRRLIFVGLLLAFGLYGALATLWLPPDAPYVGIPLICIFALGFYSHYRLRNWPCPRCGKPYFSPGWYWWNFSRKNCLHCGLERSSVRSVC